MSAETTQATQSLHPAQELGPAAVEQHGWWSLAWKILLGVVAFAMVGALLYLHTWPPLKVVQSGSMEPTIGVGEAVIMKGLDGPPRVGDIVAVHPPADVRAKLSYPPEVIHRIVSIKDGKAITKGDARKSPDPWTVPLNQIHAKVIGELPAVGRVIGFLTSPMGLIWLGIGFVLLIVLPLFERQRDQAEVTRAELDELVGAVSEYGEHLRSHTEVLRAMSAASQDLAATVAKLQKIVDDRDE
jgi:signal peptidase I